MGYGTFVMPAIIMVIIQQTMLIGIGMTDFKIEEENKENEKEA